MVGGHISYFSEKLGAYFDAECTPPDLVTRIESV